MDTVEGLTNIGSSIRVIIHDPFAFLENMKTDFRLPRLRENAISMRIVRSVAEDSLRKLAPRSRNCIFADEFQLDYFETYT